MKQFDLGRRIERLLLLAAPISIACIAFLVLAYAANQRSSKSDLIIYVNQLQMSASLLRDNLNLLDKDYRKYLATTDRDLKKTLQNSYITSLRKATIFSDRKTASDYPGGWTNFDYVITNKLTASSTKSPSQIALDFLDEATEILSKKEPLLLGIEITEKSKLTIVGAELSLPTKSYIAMLQILLAPIIILWLGSFYITRVREILSINDCKSVTLIFPHIVNIYPIWKEPEPRKKNWFQYYSRYITYAWFGLIRILALSIFLGPTVGAYLAANSYLFTENSNVFLFAFSGLTGIVAAMILIIELIPMQFKRTFAVEINRYQ
jgi:hypothetical protein